MRVCVCGLWHLGSVTAACLAEHFETIAFDPSEVVVQNFAAGNPPIQEPGLDALIRIGLDSKKLQVTSDRARAVSSSEVIWITYDTPVDENDVADVAYVSREIELLLPYLQDGATVLISSQLPVGSTARVESLYRQSFANKSIRFAYSPENLRLGKALDVFRNPDRVVVGVRDAQTREVVSPLFGPFTSNIEWMRVESAEMTKHALNAFLATSVTFINEIAAVCEQTGADAREVERGLKTDIRIGPRAYLGPGGAFAGGTLARDIEFLTEIARKHNVPAALIPAVRTSNEQHKAWPQRKLLDALGEIAGKSIAVLGLTYKPGTDTLRRSSAIELCQWIADRGGSIKAFDPAIHSIPPETRVAITLAESAQAALEGADAAVISTEWPVFREISAEVFTRTMRHPIVIDANRFLAKQLDGVPEITYIAVGKYQEGM